LDVPLFSLFIRSEFLHTILILSALKGHKLFLERLSESDSLHCGPVSLPSPFVDSVRLPSLLKNERRFLLTFLRRWFFLLLPVPLTPFSGPGPPPYAPPGLESFPPGLADKVCRSKLFFLSFKCHKESPLPRSWFPPPSERLPF